MKTRWKDLWLEEAGIFCRISDSGLVINKVTGGYRSNDYSNNGYASLTFSTNTGGKKHYRVHRLVAMAFIPNKLGKLQVNHKDGDKKNNAVENLEWVTHIENCTHASINGLVSKQTDIAKPVVLFDLVGNELNRFSSVSEAGRATGCYAKRIADVCHGRRKTTGGYVFSFV